MKHILFGRYSVPLIALGGLVAMACLGSTWYLNRLQTDLAQTVRQDAAGTEAAVELQVQLRHLRVHSLVLAADPSPPRREVVSADLARIDAALAAVQATANDPEDVRLASQIVEDYARYRRNLDLDALFSPEAKPSDAASWSDAHHMSELLVPCRALADRQRERMNGGLERSQNQTAWAGRILLGLGLVGVLAGVLSGYATARAVNRRVAHLSVRVQAVQAHLDQDVGAMTVERPSHFGDLDVQLDRVVERVKEVCQKVQEQERDLLRAEQLAAVGQLAAGVAHEVRNPLTGIKLLLQAAVRTSGPTPLTADRLHLLLQEVARIERTVQGLLDFARTAPPDRQLRDLRSVVATAVGLAQGRAEAKSVVIRTESPPNELRVSADHDQLLALLTNLLANAIEATPPGGEVGVTTGLDSGGMIRVEVWDTGPGIDPLVADRLFDPFVTTKPTGTGLGLNVARRIAHDHKGTLAVANRLNGGTCFTLMLPTAEPSHAEATDR
jgi:two-component system, NtrC family, sensor histidine kinase HydH